IRNKPAASPLSRLYATASPKLGRDDNSREAAALPVRPDRELEGHEAFGGVPVDAVAAMHAFGGDLAVDIAERGLGVAAPPGHADLGVADVGAAVVADALAAPAAVHAADPVHADRARRAGRKQIP